MSDYKEMDGEESFEEMLASSFDFAFTPPRRGEIREATILQIDEREIIVDLGAKQDGIVPLARPGAHGRRIPSQPRVGRQRTSVHCQSARPK